MIKIIEQKNQEIENIEEKYILKQKNAVSESVQTNLKEILLDMPENKYLTDEKAQNYEDILYKYIYDENRNSEIIERFSHSIKPISQEEKQNKSKEELLIYASGLESKLEKEKYTHENLKKEFDEVKDTLKKVISNKLPSLDDFKQKIKQDITKTYENERLGLLGDLQKRTDKVN